MARDAMGFCDCPAGPDCRDECEVVVMVEHKHVMLLEAGDDGRSWFYCSLCPAVVGVLPHAVGQDLKLSLAVIAAGRGGFTVDELAELGRFWRSHFRAFMHEQGAPRPGRRRYRKVRQIK